VISHSTKAQQGLYRAQFPLAVVQSSSNDGHSVASTPECAQPECQDQANASELNDNPANQND
jgi:hypothetical protein